MSQRADNIQAIIVEEDEMELSVFVKIARGDKPSEPVKFIEEHRVIGRENAEIDELNLNLERLKMLVGAEYTDGIETALVRAEQNLTLLERARSLIANKRKGRGSPKILKELDKRVKRIRFLKANYGKDIPAHWKPVWNPRAKDYEWEEV